MLTERLQSGSAIGCFDPYIARDFAPSYALSRAIYEMVKEA